ncbi:MAG: small metal-binding protein SmbP [Nitrospirota bacterium]|nr:small metal-binding protein SmbP [Nitrospirota bacterium]
MHVCQFKGSLWAAMLSIMLVVGCASYSTGSGGGNPHVAEAITHAQEAADHGGMGPADALVKHAEVALQHAQAAAKEMTNPHLDAGIAELGEAITHGKAGHADVATQHANSAVMHLKEIT